MNTNVIRLANALLRMSNNDNFFTETHAVGGGEWSIEVFFWNEEGQKEFVTEFVGSNGTRDNEPTDLWAIYHDRLQAAKGLNAFVFGGGFIAK